MRPNIDIPWSIHGRVKDHAERNDMDLTEAYSDVLESGLDAVESPSEQ